MTGRTRLNLIRSLTGTNARYDWVLLATVITLCVFGLAFLSSALSINPDLFFRQFFYQIVYGVLLGSFVCFVLARTDYHQIFKYKNAIIIITFILLGYLAIFGAYVYFTGLSIEARGIFISQFENWPIKPKLINGAIRWIDLPLVQVQPTEIAKLTLLIFFAGYLQNLEGKEITAQALKRPLYALLLTAFLIIAQPDLGSVLLIGLIIMTALWLTGVPSKIIITVILGVCLFGAMFGFSGYRLRRIQAIFNINDENAYQIKQAQLAIQNGGMWGQGYGNSVAKQQKTILEGSTDSIIAIIGEESGFVGVTAILSMYLIIFYRGLKIAREARDNGGRALAIGISVWIVSQAFLNIGGITGLVPLKGLPLPFISYGNSAMVLNLAAIGILLNISSQSNTLSPSLKSKRKAIA